MSILLLLAALASLQLEGAPAELEPVDPRTIEVLREECLSTIERREVTLFANGTIRLRQGPRGGESMRLAEISREEVAALQAILDGLDLSETDPAESALEGDWVSACTLVLAGPDARLRRFRYGRFGSHSLALSRAIAIAGDLVERAAKGSDRPREIPADYRPRPGERLERADGEIFEVVGPTVDGKGVELVGVRLPLTLYLRIEDLDVEFVRVVERRRGP